LNVLLAPDELDRGDFDRFGRGADDDQGAVVAEAINQRGHRLRAGRSGKDGAGAAEFLQLCGGVCCDTIYVHARSQFFCEGSVLRATSNRRDLVAELLRELNSQVSEAA